MRRTRAEVGPSAMGIGAGELVIIAVIGGVLLLGAGVVGAVLFFALRKKP